jgi:hypothetical protein
LGALFRIRPLYHAIMPLVSIFDGPQLLEARECRPAQLADGRQAAIYRGLAFPLLPPGDAIDVSGEAHPPALLSTIAVGLADPSLARPYAIITGDNSAYVLLAGSSLEAEKAAAELRKIGVEVVRTGRYLGDPVGGFVADWFVRVVTPREPTTFEAQLAALFGAAQTAPEGAIELRVRLLAGELESARDRARRAEEEVARLRLLLNEQSATSKDVAVLRDLIESERRQREIAEANAGAALAQLEAAVPITARAPLSAPSFTPRRVVAEITDVLSSLLPRVRLLRDGLNTIAVEFADRRSLYRVLAELQHCETARPERWKTVQNAEDWIEQSKVGNGVDSQGRVYARLDRSDRSWDVLVSHKSTQERDVEWLKRQ